MEFYQILRAARQFERAFAQRISPVLERWSLTTGEMQVLLFLANNPGCDTARDMVVVRGLGKSQVSQAVELLVGKGDRSFTKVKLSELLPYGFGPKNLGEVKS